MLGAVVLLAGVGCLIKLHAEDLRLAFHYRVPISLVVGLCLVVLGWRFHRLKRLFDDTPTSRIASAAMGLVELAGEAEPRMSMYSPLSRISCCYWQCVVEQHIHDGWFALGTFRTAEPFYLADLTGRVLVDPVGAQFHFGRLSESQANLDSFTRHRLETLLKQWGISATDWFGHLRPLRVREWVIRPGHPLCVRGELAHRSGLLEDQRHRYREYLRAIKADPRRMAEADLDHDGFVDSPEWDAYRRTVQQEFLEGESKASHADKLVVRAPEQAPYVIATGSREHVGTHFAAGCLVPFGLGLCGLGVWLAVMERLLPGPVVAILTAVVFLAILLVGTARSKKGGKR